MFPPDHIPENPYCSCNICGMEESESDSDSSMVLDNVPNTFFGYEYDLSLSKHV